MAVEEIHIVYLHSLQALVKRGHQVFSGAPVAIRPRPHVVTCFRRDEQLVTIRTEILIHQSSHRLLSRAVNRSIVVGQIEMVDTVIKSIVSNLTAAFVRINTTKIMPEAEAYLGQ